MTEHDPLCRWKPGILSFCECEVIAEVRADERAAQARWKAEAIEVIRQWEQVWELLGSPGQLGASKAAATLAAVTSWGYILEAANVANAARRELSADLRAKVEALPNDAMNGPWVMLEDVLNLIDGGQ
jgi:hypothetical protein